MGETCLICDEVMCDFKHELTLTARFSDRPIYMMFEACMSLRLPPDVIEKAGICQNCYIKINEIDEHQTIAEKIQSELLELYNTSLSSSADIKKEIKVESFNIFEIDLEEDMVVEALEEINEIIFDEKPEIKAPVKPAAKKKKTPKEPKAAKKPKEPKPAPKKRVKNEDDRYITFEIDGKRVFQCLVCNKAINHRPKQHLLSHTTERNFKCEVCGSAFKTAINLNSHRRSVHEKKRYFFCDLCGGRYGSKPHLRNHIETIHLNRKNYVCNVCGLAFGARTSLTNHLQIHQPRVRNIECAICGFKTYANGKLKRHMMSHTGERNFSCPICGKHFVYSYNVNQHINYVHKGIRVKVDESKLTCHVCGLRFPKQWRVREHLKDVHGVEDDPKENEYVFNRPASTTNDLV